MRFLLLFICLMGAEQALHAQKLLATERDTTAIKPKPKETKPEIFTSGFIDIMGGGNLSAGARFVRLQIGEPGVFSVPLSLYGAVSNGALSQTASGSGGLISKSNDHLITQYINPLSGLLNISIDGVKFKGRHHSTKVTKAGFLYHGGLRVLTGSRIGPVTSPLSGKPVHFLNNFASGGLYFQTGAWERTNSKNMGVFWLVARLHICKSDPKQIREFLPDIQTNGLYTGWSSGFGIEITNVVNIKVIYYKYLKRPEIEYGFPIYQFSFNYSMNK